MPTTAAPPRPSHRPVAGLGTMLAANLVAGAPAYFVAFLFAYGFRDVVGVAEHVAFLTMVGVFGCATGFFGALVDAAGPSGRSLGRSLAVVVPASLSLNCVVVAVGSVVSALHKDEGSVSAAFSPVTDVAVCAGLLLLAGLLALVSYRSAAGGAGRRTTARSPRA